MKWLRTLEKRFGHLAVPNLVPAIVIGQIVVYALSYLQQAQGVAAVDVNDLVQLRPDLILKGDVWRLLTFMFEPPGYSVIWTLIYWYALWFIGHALERLWGAFQLTLYLAIGYASTVAVSFFLPIGFDATNAYLYTSLFLAYAKVYPDAVFYIYLIIPLKAKWAAALTWAFFALRISFEGWPAFWLILATVADYLLFFGVDAFGKIKDAKRRQDFRTRAEAGAKPVQHECRVCGLTSAMDPKASFRYCSRCAGQCCYCPEHLKDHECVTEEGLGAGD